MSREGARTRNTNSKWYTTEDRLCSDCENENIAVMTIDVMIKKSKKIKRLKRRCKHKKKKKRKVQQTKMIQTIYRVRGREMRRVYNNEKKWEV